MPRLSLEQLSNSLELAAHAIKTVGDKSLMVSSERPLEGKVAIVTGASRGIGCAIAERIASAGAHVVAASRTLDDKSKGGVQQTVERITARGGQAIAFAVDMESAESRERLIAQTIDRMGRIDILVNNAGTAIYLSTDQMPLAAARAQTETYFLGPWHLCHLALPHMKRQGEGRILNIGSCVCFPPEQPYDSYYSARGFEALYAGLKTGLHRFSQGLAAEVFPHKIAVNVLGPVAAVYTPGVAGLGLGLTSDSEICEPPEDMAEAALEILSRPVSYTGQVEFSHKFLQSIGRSSMSVDGVAVVVERRAVAAHRVG
jgi:NAD(P)-dependent dehydrogenase (short-subunit alcohol dehydrogenase family)